MHGGVDDFQAHEAHDFRGARGLPYEEVDACLPGLGFVPNLVEKFISLDL